MRGQRDELHAVPPRQRRQRQRPPREREAGADGEQAERQRRAREQFEDPRGERGQRNRRRCFQRDAGDAREDERIARKLERDATATTPREHPDGGEVDDRNQHARPAG